MIQRTVKVGDSSVKSVQINNPATGSLVLSRALCRGHTLEMSQALTEMTDRLSISFTSY